MRIEILKEKPMRGCLFENIGRIMLRRINDNNYIFLTRHFDNLFQLLERYRLKYDENMKELIIFLSNNFTKFDIIEFILDEDKNILKVIIYDVKSKYYTIKRDYFEFCKSNYEFIEELIQKYNIIVRIVNIDLYNYWNCDLKIHDYKEVKKRIYKYHKKK